MKLEELKHKKILIIGSGIEGKSTFDFLKKNLPDCEIDFTDQKDGLDYLDIQKDYDLAIRSPGVPKKLITIPCTTATNIFFANARGTIIGVTGSKGKSTTASLIYEIAKEAGKNARLVGNIGSPMLSALDDDNRDVLYVAELSSYQLEDIKYSPHISVITNIFPDHMDYHGGFESYLDAKKNIVARANRTDYLIYNQDYRPLRELTEQSSAHGIPFLDILPFGDDSIPLLGKHNIDNVRAAITAARALSIPDEISERAVRKFKSLPHRLQLVGTYKGISFYDDAISTTPESTIAATSSFPKIGTILLGGKDRGYDFTELAKELAKRAIPNLVLFPETDQKIIAELGKCKNYSPRVFQTTKMEEAVKFAFGNSLPGSVCLLSPASPSYNLWKNFEEKGDEFQKYVALKAVPE